MKSLYFDLIGGISGDMTVAALLDLGVSFNFLKKELAKLAVRGYSLKLSDVTRGHGRARKFDVVVVEKKNFSHRQIVKLIKTSRLAAGAKARALAIYETLLKAEEKVHGHAHHDARFHEVGDTDSLVDIAGAAVCLEALGIKDVLYSALPVNSSLAPATMEMLQGKQVLFTGKNFENITPTGMAILAASGRQVERNFFRAYEMGRSGYGGGSLDPVDVANVVRVTEIKGRLGLEEDKALVLEANIDDMNPQFFEAVTEKLFAAGAFDVFVTNILMKKSRPAFLLTVLSNVENFDKIARIVLSDTTTIGLRLHSVDRLKLSRKTAFVNCRGRRVRVKLCEVPGKGIRVQPEYEDCKALAASKDLAVAEVYWEIKKKAEEKWPSQA